MKIVLTFFLIITSFFVNSDVNTGNLSYSNFTVNANSMAEFLKDIIEKEGIKSYTVMYKDPKKKQKRTYFECVFPGNNFISFGESGNLTDIGFNLNQLVRYSVFKKDFKREESISRLELLF